MSLYLRAEYIYIYIYILIDRTPDKLSYWQDNTDDVVFILSLLTAVVQSQPFYIGC